MKLKIADEKLDELALKYVIKRSINDCEDGLERTLVIQAIKNTHRAAEQIHQVTVDKLNDEITKLKEELNRHKDLLRAQCNRTDDLKQQVKDCEQALKNWMQFEQQSIAKDGPYCGKEINKVIKNAEDVLKKWSESE